MQLHFIKRLLIGASLMGLTAQASILDEIGYTFLLERFPGLTTEGVVVGMAEAQSSPNGEFHFNIDDTFWDSDTDVWFFSLSPNRGYTTSPNSNHLYQAALNSSHATTLAQSLSSITPGLQKYEVYNATYFYNSILRARNFSGTWNPTSVQASIINQSYVFIDSAVVQQASLLYDAYANRYGTLFVNAALNEFSSTTYAPGSMYNGITVGRIDGNNSSGVHLVTPSNDNLTSYSAPYVTGAAALLKSAAMKLDASIRDAASDSRVIKALLINGANNGRYLDWNTGINALENGLDARYGAGVLNIDRSHQTLTAGKIQAGQNISAVANGWNLSEITEGSTDHYYLSIGSGLHDLSVTITWNSVTDVGTYNSSTTSFTGTNQISHFNIELWQLIDNVWTYVYSIDDASSNIAYLHYRDISDGDFDIRINLHDTADSSGIETYALSYNLDAAAVPEPSSMLLVTAGSFLLLANRRRRKLN